jgi:hypothetical protein
LQTQQANKASSSRICDGWYLYAWPSVVVYTPLTTVWPMTAMVWLTTAWPATAVTWLAKVWPATAMAWLTTE